MEKAPISFREKLTVAAAIDYPAASEILVSFPDQWELVHQLWREDTPLYIAALPASQERPRHDHFYGLPPGINLSLTSYRQYRLFYPWPMPEIIVGWNDQTQTGRVEQIGHLKIHLQPMGEAQAWYGQTYGVLWECFFNETARRNPNWQQELAMFWQMVEQDIATAKIFTLPHESAFGEGYSDFLTRLGYTSDPDYPRWWSKAVE